MPTFQPTGEPSAGPWQLEPVHLFVQRLTSGLSGLERPIIIAIDGRSASGKTTLATLISEAVPGSALVHTDDMPSSGNWSGMSSRAYRSFFDWTENLLKNVLEPAHAGEPVNYWPPAWEEWGRDEGDVEVPTGCPLLILEGVGSARHELMHIVDRVVWVQADLEQARTRGLARDGGDVKATAFWEAWMAEEFSFLAEQRPWERADVVVSGTPDLGYDPSSHVVTSLRDKRMSQ